MHVWFCITPSTELVVSWRSRTGRLSSRSAHKQTQQHDEHWLSAQQDTHRVPRTAPPISIVSNAEMFAASSFCCCPANSLYSFSLSASKLCRSKNCARCAMFGPSFSLMLFCCLRSCFASCSCCCTLFWYSSLYPLTLVPSGRVRLKRPARSSATRCSFTTSIDVADS